MLTRPCEPTLEPGGFQFEEPVFDVTVVLPCHNEGDNVGPETLRIHRALSSSGLSFEILCIDDGSTDHTSAELARAARALGVTVLTNQQQNGAGAARRLGTSRAKGRIVVWTDCDLTYPNHQIADLVRTLDQHPEDAEQLIGARTIECGRHACIRAVTKALIRSYFAHRVGTPITDLNSGLRVFYRDSAAQTLPLLPDGFSCTTTMTLAFLLQGRTTIYEPIAYEQRSGKSKFRPLADTYRLIRQGRRVLAHHTQRPSQAQTTTARSVPRNPSGEVLREC